MKRIPEAEIMSDIEQARAYANADFSEPHNHFVALFASRFSTQAVSGQVLDLGCGAADICVRFANYFSQVTIDGVDASEAMLQCGRERICLANLDHRVSLYQLHLPQQPLPKRQYPYIISNSLLHHLADPMDLWRTVKQYAIRGCAVFVMDLLRPDSTSQAERLVAHYANDEPKVLREDFYASLLAAYTIEEIQTQLDQQGLRQLKVEQVSDRHVTVSGIV